MNNITTLPVDVPASNLYNPSSADKEGLPFRIKPIEWIGQDYTEAIGICQHFLIVWIKTGNLLHHIDCDTYQMQNALYCVSPGHIHRLQATDQSSGYVILFNAESITGISGANLLFNTNVFHSYPINLFPDLSPESAGDIEDIFFRLSKEFTQYSLLRFEILSSFMKILLTYLRQHSSPVYSQPSASKRTDIVKRFFSLLEAYYKSKKKVTDYASEMAIAPSYLNELIKKATGISASYHIRQRIVLEAKRQAAYNGLTMKETAYFLGFDDLAHFSKFFKGEQALTTVILKKDT